MESVSTLRKLKRLLKDPKKFRQWLDAEGSQHLPLILDLQRNLAVLDDLERIKPNVLYVPNVPQEQFHGSPCKGRAMFMGNRGGKTTALVLECHAWTQGRRHWWPEKDPRHHIDVRVPNVGRIYVNDFKAWERDVAQEWDKWVPRGTYKFTKNSAGQVVKITMTNQSVIYIMTSEMDPNASEGGKLDWVAYNEPPNEAHFKAAQRGLVDTGGHWWMALTLLDDQPWIYDKIWERAADDPNIEVIEGSSEDNLLERGGVLSRENLDEFAKFLTKEEREARISGRPIYAAGRIFKAYQPKPPWLIDPAPIEPHWPRFMAIDPHPRKPWGVLWCCINPHGGTVYIVHELYEDYIRTLDEFVEQVRFVENKLHFATSPRGDGVNVTTLGEPTFRWIDPTAVTHDPVHGLNWQTELSKRGLDCATWTRAHKNTRISTAQDWLRVKDRSGTPVIQVFNTCKRLDYELRHYYWDPKTGKPRKEGDDLVDCLLAFTGVDVLALARSIAPQDHPGQQLSPEWADALDEIETSRGREGYSRPSTGY